MSGHRAREVNEIIDRMGVNKAYAKYVTDDMVRAVNAANKELVERKRALRCVTHVLQSMGP